MFGSPLLKGFNSSNIWLTGYWKLKISGYIQYSHIRCLVICLTPVLTDWLMLYTYIYCLFKTNAEGLTTLYLVVSSESLSNSDGHLHQLENPLLFVCLSVCLYKETLVWADPVTHHDARLWRSPNSNLVNNSSFNRHVHTSPITWRYILTGGIRFLSKLRERHYPKWTVR